MNRSNPKGAWPRCLAALLLALVLQPGLSSTASAALSLQQAIALAQQQDPWIAGSEYRQQALEAQSIAAGSLPDPMVSAGFANLPTDTFNFDQEAMTQFTVGVSQALPRGDSLELRKQQLGTLGQQHPYQRADRRAKVASEVSSLWLDAWRARESIRLIEGDRDLFEQLVDIAQSNYANALGGTRQQDLVRAQLELTHLEDRLLVLHEQLEMARSRLGQWLLAPDQLDGSTSLQPLSKGLPATTLHSPELLSGAQKVPPQRLAEELRDHPAILAQDSKLKASSTGIELAQQQYRPQWRLNASYGYREDDPMGNDRADFFSVGVAFDLPLFTDKRQDRQVQSAQATTESVRTERALLLRSMIAQFNTHHARLLRLEQRQALYSSRLLEEMDQQAEASLAAYTNDDADFAEVVRAKIDELNARIEALGIDVERQKTIARLNYFFAAPSAPEDI